MGNVRQAAGALAAAWILSLGLADPAGASSANVAALQVALRSHGLYPIAVDGVRGPFTRRGVLAFQRRHGLLADGIAGRQTRRALGRRGRPRLGLRIMRRAHRGWDVAGLQFMLQRRGYRLGALDGIFGAGTHSALIAFQRSAGLTVDGLAGPATVAMLRHHGSGPRRAAPVGAVRFYRPLASPIADRFGAPRPSGRRHSGLDFPAARGTPVQASGVGTVIYAGWNSGGYGNLVVVQHRLGYTTWYAHMASVATWVGQHVSGGSRLGYVGSTGNSTGPHLHWEARLNNVPIDPLPYMLAGTAAAAQRPATARALCGNPDAYRSARINDCRRPE